ncbi:hypothetical protein BH11ACT6_BH11ACT6_19010 [soil metagenome]
MPQPVPAPPIAEGVGLPWDVPVTDAVAVLAEGRRCHGDTFAVESGGEHYLFTFSPVGVASFYALPEEQASKGLADYVMLRRKLPDELFDGRRTLPGDLFRREDVDSYLSNLAEGLDRATAELGETGSCDVFDLARRLAHRMGLASWAGAESADGTSFEQLVAAFDVLDGAEAFVHPDRMAAVAASGKCAEREALQVVVDVVGAADTDVPGLFGRIAAAWSGEAPENRRRGIGYDVALIHIASMSNLAAALGWVLVDLLAHPVELRRVVDRDDDLARRCALESTRLAQRSIMSRSVLTAVRLNTGAVTYEVPPGWTIATLLPLLNTSAAPGLDRWDPDRWRGHRLRDPELASPMLVTAFGHGRHTCPAQSFSLSAMTLAAQRLLGRYEMTPRWTARPQPVAAQIGGVARAQEVCLIDYRVRTTHLQTFTTELL